LQDLLKNLGVLELLLDLADDGLGKLTLFALLNLSFIAHPRVKNLLSLGGKGSSLFQFVGLSLELGGFLIIRSSVRRPHAITNGSSHLGNLEELLGDINNSVQLLNIVNALLDGVGVVGTRSVQDVLVLLNLAIGPLLVYGTAVLSNSGEDAEQTESGNGFLV
jgi:hypothetical protein